MTTSSATLLFVDDDPDIRELLVKTFQRRFKVLSAANGTEALALLAAHPVDVMVTDQRMPEMTGISLAHAARAAGHDVVTILLTAYTDTNDLIAAINQGQVYRYLMKPWDVQELLFTVKNAVEYAQLRKEKDRLLTQLNQRVEALGVLYEVSQKSGDAPTYDLIVERVLEALGRVLPFDCGAALVTVDEGRSATFRLRCQTRLPDATLSEVREATLAELKDVSGLVIDLGRVQVKVSGADARAKPARFGSRLSVPLRAQGRTVGVLMLLSEREGAYAPGDSELLDTLANQTTGAILSLRAVEEQSHRRLESTVESMADGVLVTDGQGDVVVTNPAARKLLRLPDEARGWQGRAIEDILGQLPQSTKAFDPKGVLVRREQLKKFESDFDLAITPVMDGTGALGGVCVVVRDVTEQKRIDARKDEFVSMVSHELRTPLTAIQGALELVLNGMVGEVNARQQRYLTLAKESTDRLNAIVDDLLDLSKLSQGPLAMSLASVDLRALVSRALEQHAAALSERQIRLVPCLPRVPVPVSADGSRFEQVLANLFSNATKFTPEGGSLTVELLRSPRVPGYAVLTVTNTGEAIQAEDLERIFGKFEQARSERTRTIPGTGLGLSICREIVEGHGGRIWAEPMEDGARFVVVLPAAPELAIAREDEAPLKGALQIALPDEALAYVLKGWSLGQAAGVRLSDELDVAALPELAVVEARDAERFTAAGIARLVLDPEELRTATLSQKSFLLRIRAAARGSSDAAWSPPNPPN